MNVLPVISRELRVQARQPFTYALRMLGVVALLAGGFLLTDPRTLLPMQGAPLFGRLHMILFGAIWILVPLGAADCLSRERREGTLPLLFLTPLKAIEIVVAKSLAHGLRAMTLVVAVLPVLTIPFLMGGVSWKAAATSALTNLSALCWALAAALAASAGNRSAVRAQAMTMLLAVGALAMFITTTGWSLALAAGLPLMRGVQIGSWLLTGWFFYGPGGVNLGPSGPVGNHLWITYGLMLVAALAALTVSLAWAAWIIRRTGREQPPPEWAQRMETWLCTPVLGAGLLRRWLRRTLERNPIGWLERRTWQGRLVAWSWIAVLISIYSYVVTESFYLQRLDGLQSALGWLLTGSVAASAAGSFRRERETGVLELLLVSPLSARQIVLGRLRGLWAQFLPAFAFWLAVWLYFERVVPESIPLGRVGFFVSLYFVLPVVGLYFSLRCRSFLTAFVLTVLVGYGLPSIAGRAAAAGLLAVGDVAGAPAVSVGPGGFATLASLLAQAGLACWAWLRLTRALERRAFPLERVGA
jgi:ABC-type transport system involved in multi-copper enzyme maturation permease subunit